ncbi:MAG: hypothetical protein RLZZ293_1244, partial [Pseudomonadota bacterium]
ISNAFKWIIAQIEQRCQLMLKLKTKDISSLNHKINTNLAQGKPILNPFCPVTEPEYLQPLPYLVIIIDELADLIVAEGKDIEKYIIQICQKSQAVGIHLIISTIKPSLELIANIPARLSFQLLNKQQSELILDYSGAETLLDYGDMLLLSPSNPILKRIHSPYIEHDEIQPLLDQLLQYASKKPDTISSNPDSSYDQALDFILTSRRCSISALQTQFGMGYNQACNIINQFIQSGIVQKNKNGSLQVLADKNNK